MTILQKRYWILLIIVSSLSAAYEFDMYALAILPFHIFGITPTTLTITYIGGCCDMTIVILFGPDLYHWFLTHLFNVIFK